ncbi:MAG: hypothetical protein J5725_12115 [Bacteroidales bacterium]|nr:hypothetical protein [Bacteroidales bacterium]
MFNDIDDRISRLSKNIEQTQVKIDSLKIKTGMARGITFKGSVDKLPDVSTLSVGDTVKYEDKFYTYDGKNWVSIASSITSTTDNKYTISSKPHNITATVHLPQITKLENCSNCGGTVDDHGYCKYCGSKVYHLYKEESGQNYIPHKNKNMM